MKAEQHEEKSNHPGLTQANRPPRNPVRFKLPDGRQLAIKPLKTQITVFAEPGVWEGKLPSEWKVVRYAPGKTRSSNLPQCAPRLSTGNPAVCLALTGYADFERFIRIYGSEA